MPPTGVLISTCLSSPFFSFFTLTLQAGSNKDANVAHAKASPQSPRNLVLRMPYPFYSNLRRTFEAGAALGNIWDADGQTPANWNLPEKRFNRAHLRHVRVGKRAHVVFDLGKIAGQIGMSHG